MVCMVQTYLLLLRALMCTKPSIAPTVAVAVCKPNQKMEKQGGERKSAESNSVVVKASEETYSFNKVASLDNTECQGECVQNLNIMFSALSNMFSASWS